MVFSGPLSCSFRKINNEFWSFPLLLSVFLNYLCISEPSLLGNKGKILICKLEIGLQIVGATMPAIKVCIKLARRYSLLVDEEAPEQFYSF